MTQNSNPQLNLPLLATSPSEEEEVSKSNVDWYDFQDLQQLQSAIATYRSTRKHTIVHRGTTHVAPTLLPSDHQSGMLSDNRDNCDSDGAESAQNEANNSEKVLLVSGSCCSSNITEQQYRNHVMTEFLTSEESYIHQLDVLNDEFIEPIVQQGILTPKVAELMFPVDIQIIRKVNKNFYSHLRQIVFSSNRNSRRLAETDYQVTLRLDTTKPKTMQLAQLFLYFAQGFRLYIGYITKYSTITKVLREEVKRPNVKLNEFLKDRRSRLKTRGEKVVNITDYLIVMIQRLPRYRLLMEDLRKHTDPNDESYSTIIEACKVVASIAKFCNDKEREFKINSVTADLQLSLRMKLPNGTMQDFIQPSRQLIEQHTNDQTAMQLVMRDGRYGPCDLYIFSDSIAVKKRYGVNQNKTYVLYLRVNCDTPFGQVSEVSVNVEWLLETDGRALSIATTYQKDNEKVTKKFAFVCGSTDTCSQVINTVNRILASKM